MNWISVKDGLPYVNDTEPFGVTVLVWTDKGYWTVADYTHGGLWIKHHHPLEKVEGVTHWSEVKGPIKPLSVVDKIKYYLIQCKERGDKPSSFKDSVWYSELRDKYLYDDEFLDTDEMNRLIADKSLKYKEDGLHQGEKMLRYTV